MGLNIEELFGSAKQSIDQALNQVKTVGIPALQNAGEQWAANVLREQSDSLLKQNKETQKQLAKEVNTVLKAPKQPGSFGSFFSEGITGAGMSTYGLPIILGVVGLVFVGLYFGKGK